MKLVYFAFTFLHPNCPFIVLTPFFVFRNINFSNFMSPLSTVFCASTLMNSNLIIMMHLEMMHP